mgnify:CR=1 FL=1
MAKNSTATKVRKYMVKHPNATVAQIAEATGAHKQQVYNIRWAVNKAKKAKPDIIKAHYGVVKKITETLITPTPKTDNVNHPAHYKVGGIETIDFIEAKKLNYNLGNVVKYVTRADHKGARKQDLEKAVWYLQREISSL